MSKPNKFRFFCKWCEVAVFKTWQEKDEHQVRCIKGPRTFRSLGKTFMTKPNRPERDAAPEARTSAIVYTNGKTYPILQDDIFLYYKQYPDNIERLGTYTLGGTTFHCFRVIPKAFPSNEDIDLFDKIWGAIRKAHKAGVSLYD